MSLWDVFKAKPKRHTFDDEDRELSSTIRKIRKETLIAQETAKLREAEADLKAAEEDLNGSQEQDPMQLLMMAVLSQLTGGVIPTSETVSPTPAIGSRAEAKNQGSLINYSDEEIEKVLNDLPKDKKKLLKLAPQQLLRSKLRSEFQADDDSIERALVIISGR